MILPDTNRSTSHYHLGLCLLLLLGFGIRLAGIDAQSIWYDEASTAELTQASYVELLTGAEADAGNPPFYWLMAKTSADLFGFDAIGLRIFSVLCGTVTILFLASIARMVISESAALIVGLLWAISPLSLELSTAARSYALLHMLIAVNTWLFLLWLSANSKDA